MSRIQRKFLSVLSKGTNLGTAEAAPRTRPPTPASVPVSASGITTKKKELDQDPSQKSPASASFRNDSAAPQPPPIADRVPQRSLPPLCDIPVREQNMKLDWPLPDFTKPHLFWKARSTLTIFMVGLWSKSVLSLNKSRILNKDRMSNAIFNRPVGTSLVTVSNHESCIDDPALIAAFMTMKQLANYDKMRWSLAAYDICYRSKLEGSIFSLGKCVPVVRGDGVYQKAVDFAIQRLNLGEWVHIFPEGRINTERQDLYRLKWGTGRILAECQAPLILLPFWHTGMSNVLPNHTPYIPRFGKEVIINVGEAINLTEILHKAKGKSAMERRKLITDFIQGKLKILREETLHLTT